MDAPCNTPADLYRYNPWRAPGAAPVLDSCGMAGGGPKDQGGEAKYDNVHLYGAWQHHGIYTPLHPLEADV